MVNVAETVHTILLDILDIGADEIIPTARLTDDLKATSIDLVDIVTALENAFEVTITEAEIARLRQGTVQQAVDFLQAATAQQARGAS